MIFDGTFFVALCYDLKSIRCHTWPHARTNTPWMELCAYWVAKCVTSAAAFEREKRRKIDTRALQPMLRGHSTRTHIFARIAACESKQCWKYSADKAKQCKFDYARLPLVRRHPHPYDFNAPSQVDIRPVRRCRFYTCDTDAGHGARPMNESNLF